MGNSGESVGLISPLRCHGSNPSPATKSEFRIMVIIGVFQTSDVGSIPTIRSGQFYGSAWS